MTLDLDQLVKERALLGQGGYGVVVRGKLDGVPVAIKVRVIDLPSTRALPLIPARCLPAGPEQDGERGRHSFCA